MSTYTATVRWNRTESAEGFAKGQYSRAHEWAFDGGAVVPASASPHVVPAPWSNAAGVDPEEAFVASLASCHMLFFLDFASRAGFRIDSYEDAATGEMGKDGQGKLMVAKVTLSPRIVFSGDKRPSDADIAALHHKSHEECFIANSVKTEIVTATIPPQFA